MQASSGASWRPLARMRGRIKAGSEAWKGMRGRQQRTEAMDQEKADAWDDKEERSQGYRMPPPNMASIVDAPPTPSISISPRRDRVLVLDRPPSNPPIEDLSREELKLGGLRIDPRRHARARLGHYVQARVVSLEDCPPKEGVGVVFTGLPPRAKLNFVSWSPGGTHVAMAVSQELDPHGQGDETMHLHVADVEDGVARKLPLTNLACVFEEYKWIDNQTLLAAVVSKPGTKPPERPRRPQGPRVDDWSQEEGRKAQARTYQDLLKDAHDEDLFEHFCTAQLVTVHVDAEDSSHVKPLGEPKIYVRCDPSPDGKYAILEYIQKPFSYLVPCGRFPKTTELWSLEEGKRLKTIADLPLAEDIPVAFNSTRKGPRSVYWRPDKRAELYWVETQDGGDPAVEVSPRDIVYTLNPSLGEDVDPEILATFDLRFSGMLWGTDNLAIAYESWWKTRRSVSWTLSPGTRPAEKKILFDRSFEDSYSDPGAPIMRRNEMGMYVLVALENCTKLLLEGQGASPEGDCPFLDLYDLSTGEKERIWQSQTPPYLESLEALLSDGPGKAIEKLEDISMLKVRESPTDPPQFYVHSLKDSAERQITDFPHPYPSLKELQKEIVRYKRDDGVDLQGTLYLPPGYDAARDGPLPCLFWAYPREFKSKDAAGQMRGSPYRFTGIGATSPILFLARKFAVFDGPTFPIIGEGDEMEPNDTYVEQLTASARAAVDEVVRRGVAKRGAIAVGGHSYGAFMTANLLAHCPGLFACGIARSGAYNRTLTPFGFQSEERTLWQAPETYMTMSPFMNVEKIKDPLLLIHGEDDNNSGTFPMQSERFYSALKGHGVPSRLVILPHESHGYRARESVMHVLWEMDTWLQKYCVTEVEGSSGPAQENAFAKQ